MQITTTQAAFKTALETVGRATSTRSTLPILANVLLAAEHGRLKLGATNLEMAITTWVAAEAAKDGTLTVPARPLTEFVATLPEDEDVTLSATGTKARVASGKTEATLHGMDAEDFPVVPSIAGDPLIKIEPSLLKSMVDQVAFAAATDDSRPVLAGVLFRLDPGKLTMAAADGFRLAVREQDVAFAGQPTSVIVPAKTLVAVARLVEGSDDPVEISVSDNRSQALFRAENVEVVSRLVDGNFPNYGQIIPKEHGTRAALSTQELLRSIRRAAIFARDSSNVVTLRVDPGEETREGRLLITATAAEMGAGADELPVRAEGAGMEISFNAKYLVDVLGVVGTGEVQLLTNASNAPGVVRPVGRDGYQTVVMPMHKPGQ
jgi:DNA polymerase-3 subunit beta